MLLHCLGVLCFAYDVLSSLFIILLAALAIVPHLYDVFSSLPVDIEVCRFLIHTALWYQKV